MAEQDQQNRFITPELTHRSELILHLLEYSNKLVIVKGEPDSGKSTFYKELIGQEESNLIIRNLTLGINTKTSDIFKALIDGSGHERLQDTEYSQADLNQWLIRSQNKQKIPALLIDNADLLDDGLIRYLFEILENSNKDSVLHLCLFCETSFLERLEEFGINRDDSDNLHIIEMPNLSEKQTEQYIHNNYPTEGSSDLSLFDEKTIKQIHRISHGLPGRVNALCEQYLDDPAKKSEVVEEKSPINIKPILLKNKLIILVVVLLVLLSVGVATLLNQAGKEDVKQTIMLELPKLNEEQEKQNDIVEIEVPQELEPEPVTIEELSPPVIPEIANDLDNKSEVLVYNSQGNLVAKESELNAVVVEDTVEEEIIEESVPFSDISSSTENIVEVIPEPEPEPVKISEQKSEPIVKDIKWLIRQDPKKYVLQLIGAYEQETIDVYLKSFKGNNNKIISFNASNNGKQWHVLIYGLYQNRDQAVAAIETLPTKAKLMAPWPRSVQSIKDLLQ
jgi:DamX protein